MTNVDGAVSPTADAHIPVMDRGFLYGDSIYEVFRTYDGVPLFFDEHWARFENSARLIHMRPSLTKEQMLEEISQTVGRTNAPELRRDVYVRYTMTRGEGPVDLFPGPDLVMRYVIIVKPYDPGTLKDIERGLQSGVRPAAPYDRRDQVHLLIIRHGSYPPQKVMGRLYVIL